MFKLISASNLTKTQKITKSITFNKKNYTTIPPPSPPYPPSQPFPPTPIPPLPSPPSPLPYPPNDPPVHPPSPTPPPPTPTPTPIPPVLSTPTPQYILNNHKSFKDIKFKDSEYIYYSPNGSEDERWANLTSFPIKLIPNFLSEKEQEILVADIDPKLRKRRYETAHWDYAIAGYREVTLKSNWLSKDSEAILQRTKEEIFKEGVNTLPVHVLDIEEDGFLKPHIDSVLFSGGIVSGITLLTTVVMTLQPQTLQNPHPKP